MVMTLHLIIVTSSLHHILSLCSSHLFRCDDVLDVGSVEESGRRAMLEPIILAAALPSTIREDTAEDIGSSREGGERPRETLAVDPRPVEMKKEEEINRRALQVGVGYMCEVLPSMLML